MRLVFDHNHMYFTGSLLVLVNQGNIAVLGQEWNFTANVITVPLNNTDSDTPELVGPAPYNQQVLTNLTESWTFQRNLLVGNSAAARTQVL